MLKPSLPSLLCCLAAAVLCSWPTSVGLSDDTSSDVHVSVKGLRIVTQPYAGEQTMRAFHWFAGTTLALQVDAASGGLIELDTQASKLESMTDDMDTDLLKKGDQGRVSTSGISGLVIFSEDGKAAMIEISAPETPHRAATEIRAKGTLAFRQATIKTTFDDIVTLRKRSSVHAGPIPLTVVRVGKPDWGSEPLGVTLRATQDTSAITDIRFLDVRGSPIVFRKLGSVRMGTPDQVKFDMSFELTRKVEVVTIEIDYWEDLRTITVPFEVRASVGFAGDEPAKNLAAATPEAAECEQEQSPEASTPEAADSTTAQAPPSSG